MTVWHAYRTLPRQSLVRIADDLAAHGDDVAIPIQTIYERQKIGRKVAMVPTRRVAIVPGWVFARAGIALEHRGIGLPYMDGEVPYRIPAYQIDRMMTAAAQLACAGDQVITYAIGDVVRVAGLDMPITIETMSDGRYTGAAGATRVTFKEAQIAA